MSDENPFERMIRQLEYDISQLETDAGLINNEELRVHIRAMLFDKRQSIMALWKEYGAMVEGGEV